MSHWFDWTEWAEYLPFNSIPVEPIKPIEEPTFFEWMFGNPSPEPTEKHDEQFIDSIWITYEQALEEIQRIQSSENLLEAIADVDTSLFFIAAGAMIFTLFFICFIQFVFRRIVSFFTTTSTPKQQKTEKKKPQEHLKRESVIDKKLDDIEQLLARHIDEEKVMMDGVVNTNAKLLEKSQQHFGHLVDVLDDILQGNDKHRKSVEQSGDADSTDRLEKLAAH